MLSLVIYNCRIIQNSRYLSDLLGNPLLSGILELRIINEVPFLKNLTAIMSSGRVVMAVQ